MNAQRAAILRAKLAAELAKMSPGASGASALLLSRLTGEPCGEVKAALEAMQADRLAEGRVLRQHGPVQWVPWGYDRAHEQAARERRLRDRKAS